MTSKTVSQPVESRKAAYIQRAASRMNTISPPQSPRFSGPGGGATG